MLLAHDFTLFGADHLAVLILTALCAWALIRVGKRGSNDPLVRRTAVALGIFQVLVALAWHVKLQVDGTFDPAADLPIHLCDTAAILSILALLQRRPSRLLCELVYFWGLAGTLQGLLTPTVKVGFPNAHFLYFFANHAAIVLTALFLVFGLGYRPQRGALLRVWLWLHVQLVWSVLWSAALRAFGIEANYMFVCEAPEGTLLTALGPWPWYLVVAEFVAVAFFCLLLIPLRLTAPPHAAASEDGDQVADSA